MNIAFKNRGLALWPDDENAVLDNPLSRETINNDGTTKGPGPKDAINRNIHALAYRYDNGDRGENSGYKVVAEMVVPNPGTSLKKQSF